jgi:hypothetical protein
MRIKSDVLQPKASEKRFFTDENGFTMKSHEFDPKKEFGANLYPVTSMIGIQSSDQTLMIKNDRCQAGSSVKPGQILLLINRFMQKTDTYGLDEPMQFNGELNLSYKIKID